MKKEHRVFIAINLPEDIKNQLASYGDKWPELPARWTVKDNLHITLEFLGYLTDQELADVCTVVADVAKRHSSFSVNLNKICYGPPKKAPPRMIWVEGEKSKELSDLKNDLRDSLLQRIRFIPEKQFSPHITLARIKEWEFRKINQEEIPEINEQVDFLFSVESIEVMESELKRGGLARRSLGGGGPVYTILESHNLGQ